MQKALSWFFVLMLSGSLSQSMECSCPDTNTTAKIDTNDKESLNQLRHQLEFVNAFNERLLLQIEMLSTRLNQQDEENTKRCQMDFLNSLNETLVSILNARLGQHDKLADADNTTNPTTWQYPKNCAEIANEGEANGIFTIQVDRFSEIPFEVCCNESYGAGWTVIQRRQDGSVDFYRNWTDYKKGFGNLDGEFFIGLDKLHALTAEGPQELLIVLGDFERETRIAIYDGFAIGNESEAYALKILGSYSGNAGDSLIYHLGEKFTTKDKDNDRSERNCAEVYTGAWWYANCRDSNLNGRYLGDEYPQDQYGEGIYWHHWPHHQYFLKYVQMMIRPKRN